MDKNKKKSQKKILNMVGLSKRLTLTYVVLIIWIGLAIFGVLIETDLYALAVYFSSGLPIIIGYLWSETSRPSGLDKVANIIKNIPKNQQNNNVDNYIDIDYNDKVDIDYNFEDDNINNESLNIISNDSLLSVEITQDQLLLLMNVGYVNKINDKYMFEKSLYNQILSLINDDYEPDI